MALLGRRDVGLNVIAAAVCGPAVGEPTRKDNWSFPRWEAAARELHTDPFTRGKLIPQAKRMLHRLSSEIEAVFAGPTELTVQRFE